MAIKIASATVASPTDINVDSTQLWGQSFQVDSNANLTSLVITMKTNGTPSGSFVFKIYAHSGTYGSTSVPTGTALATSDTVLVSSLTATYTQYTINFSGANQIAMTTGQQYVWTCEYNTTAFPNSIYLQGKTPSFYSGNACYFSGSWVALGSNDTIFELQGTTKIVLDNVSAQTRFLVASSGTTSHTCNGTNRLLYVTAITSDGQTVSGITYNGVSMTLIGTGGLDGANRRATTYYLVNPTSGANNIVTTLSGSSASLVVYSASYTNVDQTSPILNSSTTASFTGTTMSQSLISEVGGYLILSGTWSAGTPTPLTNCTVRQNEVAYIGSYQVDNTVGGTGSITVGFTAGSQNFTGVGVSLKSSAPLVTQLISYWKLDESSGNAADSVGANTLTNTNTATYVTGLINNAVDLGTANTNKKLTIASNLGITNGAISMSMWVKLNTEIATGTWGFAQKGNATNHVQYIIAYEYNAGSRRVVFNRQKQNSSNNTVTNTVTMGTSNFYHLVLTYDGSTLEGYVNGTSAGTLATSGDGVGSGLNQFDIGEGSMFAGTSYASIDTDETGIWNRALTAGEITSLYNSGAGLSYPFTTSSYTSGAAFLFRMI